MKLTPLCIALTLMVLARGIAIGQSAGNVVRFDVASVKLSQHIVGPDENNRFLIEPSGLTGRNVTLKRLIAEAYHIQRSQVLGPAWLDENEYDIDAKTDSPQSRAQLAQMLQVLLAERFTLLQHSESRNLRVYELVIDKTGPKIRDIGAGATPDASAGLHFHGDLQQFADLLAVQLSIPTFDDPGRPGRANGSPTPVMDETGLSGVYDFAVEVKPEPGSDMFGFWQRVLQDKLGLRLENLRSNISVRVVDRAERIPTAN